jgi:hypothetical protein
MPHRYGDFSPVCHHMLWSVVLGAMSVRYAFHLLCSRFRSTQNNPAAGHVWGCRLVFLLLALEYPQWTNSNLIHSTNMCRLFELWFFTWIANETEAIPSWFAIFSVNCHNLSRSISFRGSYNWFVHPRDNWNPFICKERWLVSCKFSLKPIHCWAPPLKSLGLDPYLDLGWRDAWNLLKLRGS